MNQITLNFKSKHTEEYVLNKCMASLSFDDADNLGCISSEESVRDDTGHREIKIGFELNDMATFFNNLYQQKISNDLIDYNVIANVQPIHWKEAISSMFVKH